MVDAGLSMESFKTISYALHRGQCAIIVQRIAKFRKRLAFGGKNDYSILGEIPILSYYNN